MQLQTNLKLMVIDDEPTSVELLEDKLQRLQIGYQLTVFEEGEKAIQYLHQKVFGGPQAREELPDLIILDIFLPGVRGLELLRVLKTDLDLKNIPVLIMSVTNRPTDILNSYKNGAVAFVSKLDQPDVLGKAIRQMWLFGMFKNFQGI